MEALLSGTVPWAKLRPAQKLLRLGTKYGCISVEEACRRALAFQVVNVHRVETILLQDLDHLALPLYPRVDTPVIPIRLRFQRPAGRFTHPPLAMMEVQPSLRSVLKRLKLSGMVATLPDRAAYAQKTSVGSVDFLELALHDEIDRRANKRLSTRLDRGGFEEAHTFEDFDWDARVTFDRDRVRDLLGLGFLERHEDVLFLGPVGVGASPTTPIRACSR